MTLAALYFFAHQPFRLRRYEDRALDTVTSPDTLERHFFDEDLDAGIFKKVAANCYLPATRLLRDAILEHRGSSKPFKVSFGLSGTFLEQAERYAPEVVDGFRELVATGCVELCGETYYHTLSSLFDVGRAEFRVQATMHRATIERLFGSRPTVFRNTEMIYNDSIAETVRDLGYRGIITEGVDWLMANWRSPDFVYSSTSGLPVLLRNYQLSDDVGYRFSNRAWESYPLRAETFAAWLAKNTDPCVLLAMDFEALGEHMSRDSGIFDFIAALPRETAKFPQLEWATPANVIDRIAPVGTVSVGDYATVSWADRERDTSAWLHNDMQRRCFEETKRLEPLVKGLGEPHLLDVWRKMQTSDHLYYLADKSMTDGDVHRYFSAYGHPLDAYVRLDTALTELRRRVEALR